MIVGGKPETKGRAEAQRIAEPGTAAKDTVVAIALCYPGGAVIGCPFVVGVLTILDPFPSVAVRIVKAELIGRKRANWSGPAVPLAAAAVAVGVAFADLVAPGIDRRCAGASRILPFGFGEQPVGPVGHLG